MIVIRGEVVGFSLAECGATPNWQFFIPSSILGDAVMVHGHCLRPVIEHYVRMRYRLWSP